MLIKIYQFNMNSVKLNWLKAPLNRGDFIIVLAGKVPARMDPSPVVRLGVWLAL